MWVRTLGLVGIILALAGACSESPQFCQSDGDCVAPEVCDISGSLLGIANRCVTRAAPDVGFFPDGGPACPPAIWDQANFDQACFQ